MGQFDCTKPADGTPLFNCCQSLQGVVPCGGVSNVIVGYGSQFYLNTNTCRVYRTKREQVDAWGGGTVTTEPTEIQRNLIDTTSWKIKPSDGSWFTNQITYTAPVALNALALHCGNTTGFVERFSCTDTTESFTLRCRNSEGVTFRGAKWEYTVDYSDEVTAQDLLGPWNELLVYAIADNQLRSAAFDLFGSPSETGWGGNPIRPACPNIQPAFDNPDAGYAAPIGGMVKLFSFGPPIGYFYTNSDSPENGTPPDIATSKCGWVSFYFQWYAWFSTAMLSEFYEVETLRLGTSEVPQFCQRLIPDWGIGALPSPVSPAEQSRIGFTCESLRTLQFADGLNDNGGQRRTLFGPISYDPHITVTRCKS